MQSDQIVRYYDECEDHYRKFWDLDQSLAMHAGYWDETTKTLRQALEKENQIMAEIAKIKTTDRILDAGCGVGGSSIYLAKRYGCSVVGITLSEKQAETAKKYASERLGSLSIPEFYVMDFNRPSFPDQSFDVVWGIESICHSSNKKQFIQEAYRLLKEGGRIVIADAFYAKDTYTDQEEQLMNLWLKGWGVDKLEKDTIFAQFLEEAGFQSIIFTDITAHVIPSSQRLFFYSFPGLFLSKFKRLFGIGSALHAANFLSARYQYRSLKRKLWRYGIFSAEKHS